MSESTQAMSRVDTAWLRMDSDVNLMMIVGVWLLRPAIRYDALCERIRERLLKYERFRQKVVQGALGSSWVQDEAFDLGRHVVVERLQRRRGQSERSALQQRMGELASVPLDHAHPLWQFQLIEHYGGGSALLCRIHHCIGDGVALNSVMMSLGDDGVEPPELTRHHADPHEAHLDDWVADELLRPLTGITVKAIGLYGQGLVPVNLRPLEEAWQLGNRFGLVPLLLPVGTANPLERLRIVHERMGELKVSWQPLLSYGSRRATSAWA